VSTSITTNETLQTGKKLSFTIEIGHSDLNLGLQGRIRRRLEAVISNKPFLQTAPKNGQKTARNG